MELSESLIAFGKWAFERRWLLISRGMCGFRFYSEMQLCLARAWSVVLVRVELPFLHRSTHPASGGLRHGKYEHVMMIAVT
jgi:hypothetical protein